MVIIKSLTTAVSLIPSYHLHIFWFVHHFTTPWYIEHQNLDNISGFLLLKQPFPMIMSHAIIAVGEAISHLNLDMIYPYWNLDNGWILGERDVCGMIGFGGNCGTSVLFALFFVRMSLEGRISDDLLYVYDVRGRIKTPSLIWPAGHCMEGAQSYTSSLNMIYFCRHKAISVNTFSFYVP